MSTLAETNKAIILRYNYEGLAQGHAATLRELLSPNFLNHSAPAGQDNGPGGILHTFLRVLHPAFTDLRVTVLDQVAEGDKVTTRKTITGRHTGELLGRAPTQRLLTIDVIDIFRLQDGKLLEHWGINTLPTVLAQLAAE